MRRTMAVLAVAVLVMVGTASAQRMAIGLKAPFTFETMNESNSYDWNTSESWIGALGTFELYALPTLGIEFGVGYQLALSGKSENGAVTEWKRNIIPIDIMLKYYPPMAPGGTIHPYLATGPRISIESISHKINDDYEKTGSLTRIYFPNPVIAGGLEFDVGPSVRIGGAIDLWLLSESYSPEGGGADYSIMSIHTGLGLVFKYLL